MARTYTADELVTKCRNRGGYENSNRLTAAKWYDFLESGVAELYDRLISKFSEDYFTKKSSPATFTPATDTYSLPSDFYKLLGVDVQINGVWHALLRIDIHERNHFQTDSVWSARTWDWGDRAPYRYRLEGTNVLIAPTPQRADTYRFVYIPIATQISTGSESIEGVNGFEELAVLYAVRRAKRSMNEPIGDLVQEIKDQEARVDWAADGRDAGQPLTIADLDEGYI